MPENNKGVVNFFVLTAAERTTAMGWDNEDVRLGARAIDNGSPGVGINLNDSATNYDPSDPVSLTGNYVCTKRIVDDDQYQIYAPNMVAYLLTLPFCMLEPETIFAPQEL